MLTGPQKAVILHGTNSTHEQNWFPWLYAELKERSYEVWSPDLPGAEKPNLDTYNSFLNSQGWEFQDNLLVGHSSGAVAILSLLESLKPDVVVDTVILVGVFRGSLGWESLADLEVSHDYQALRAKARRYVVVHSDNDPYCPLEGAQWIAEQLGAEFVLIPGQGHFNVGFDPKFIELPELLPIIDNSVTVS